MELLHSEENSFPFEIEEEIARLKKKCVREKDVANGALLDEVKSQSSTDCLRLLEAAAEREASTWLTALSQKNMVSTSIRSFGMLYV